MRRPFTPRVAPNPPDMSDLARQIGAYRAALKAQGISDDLADRLTEQFQQQVLGMALGLISQAIETK